MRKEVEWLKKRLKEKGFLNEEETKDNYLKISFMEDDIVVCDTEKEFKDAANYDETLDIQVVKDGLKLLKEGKKILFYEEWGKVIKIHHIRKIVWDFFKEFKDYVLMVYFSDWNIMYLDGVFYGYDYGNEEVLGKKKFKLGTDNTDDEHHFVYNVSGTDYSEVKKK